MNQLYNYTARNWGHHVSGSCQLVTSFLEDEPKVEASSQALLVDDTRYSQDFPMQMTGLHVAAFFGVENSVRLLLSSKRTEARDSYGRTSLSWAALEGHEAVVKLLLEKGADLESKDEGGWTPLSWAAWEDNEAVVKLLIAKGAKGGVHSDGSTFIIPISSSTTSSTPSSTSSRHPLDTLLSSGLNRANGCRHSAAMP